MPFSIGKRSRRPEGRTAFNRGSRRTALVLGSVLACALLWGTEAGLVWLHQDPFLVACETARVAGREVDLRSRAEVVAALQRGGVSAVPRIVPATLLSPGPDGRLHSLLESDASSGDELLPLSGIGSRRTVLCAEAGPFAVFESDLHGFRNPPDVWSHAPIELLLVGDSFTQGECVGDSETIADGLRNRWPRTVNLGYSGHSPLLELASLVEYGPALRPKTTLWVYFENDLSWFDLGRSAGSPLLMRYLEPGFSQRLIERRPEIDARLSALLARDFEPAEDLPTTGHAASPLRSGLASIRSVLELNRLRMLLGRVRPRLPVEADAGSVELFGKILARAAAVASEWGGEVVVVYLPGVWGYDPFVGIPAWTGPHVREAVRERVLGLQLEFIDVEQAIAEHPDPLSLYAYPGQSDLVGAPHMNASGYAFAADVIARELRTSAVRSEPDAPTDADSSLRSQISRQ